MIPFVYPVQASVWMRRKTRGTLGDLSAARLLIRLGISLQALERPAVTDKPSASLQLQTQSLQEKVASSPRSSSQGQGQGQASCCLPISIIFDDGSDILES